MGDRNRNGALNIIFYRAFPTSEGFPSFPVGALGVFSVIYKEGKTQNNFASKSRHITSLQLHLLYISGNDREWLASAMAHYSFLKGLGITVRGRKILFNFIFFILTGRYTMSNFAGGIIWGMGKGKESLEVPDSCKESDYLRRATDNNINPAYSNRSQDSQQQPWTVIVMEPLLVSDKTALWQKRGIKGMVVQIRSREWRVTGMEGEC